MPEARPGHHGGRLNAVKRKTGPGCGVVAVVALGLATATSSWSEQGKWQAGPGAVVGYLTKDFILGVFPQQWFSIGGDGRNADRPDTSQLNLQPVEAIFLGDGWNIGYSGNILANWKASSGDVWTVPIGLGVGPDDGRQPRFGRL
jgi:hypothetical protein